MNSILQCLSNTRELRDYCLQRLYLRDLSHSSRAHTALMEGEGPALHAFPLFYMLLSHFSSSGFFLLGLYRIQKMAQLSSTPPSTLFFFL